MDPLVPNQVRYRTAPHSEEAEYYRLLQLRSIIILILTNSSRQQDTPETGLIFQARTAQQSQAYRLAWSGIIWGLIAEKNIMEAERLNAISALLVDLTSRETELRGYL